MIPLPTREWVEAQTGVDGLHGIYHREYAWPIRETDSEEYWKRITKEPYIRNEYQMGDKIIVYSLPTKEAWVQLPPGTPVIIRFTVDKDGWVNGGGPLSEAEVHEYREAMYGVKDKPPKRYTGKDGTSEAPIRKRKVKTKEKI